MDSKVDFSMNFIETQTLTTLIRLLIRVVKKNGKNVD